ncbi:MAG: Uma2 family endonuclease [Microcystaceae cyanobacterium]
MTNTEVKIQNNFPISEETIKKRTTDNLIPPRIDNADNVVILNPVSWQTFNQLLEELGDKRGQRLAYCHETLEIMSPLGIHENNNRLIESLIFVIADELGLNLKKFGSLTLRRDKTQQGVEPDSCYYLQNEPLVRGKQTIDLALDPPPDLVLEIDITRGSMDKLPIYAHLGVPEVWRYDGSCLSLFALNPELKTYTQVEQSSIFPFLPPKHVPLLINRSLAIGETAALRELRQWLRENAFNFYVHPDKE